MFSTSLGSNDLIQINLNHWGEKKILKLHIRQNIKTIFSMIQSAWGLVIARLKFSFSHCIV